MILPGHRSSDLAVDDKDRRGRTDSVLLDDPRTYTEPARGVGDRDEGNGGC